MAPLAKVEIVGGGPAGLYAAILLRRFWPRATVRVREQNRRGATFGFGVVFSDRALDFLAADDRHIHDLIAPRMERWTNMTLNTPRGQVVLDGVGFSAIGRLALLDILTDRALALGVELQSSTAVRAPGSLEADLVIGADGVNSSVRQAFENEFRPNVEHFGNHFAWFGASRAFATLTQTFVAADRGAFNAHHYRYAPDRSTFIVECNPETFAAYGFGEMEEAQSAAVCQEIFASVLGGSPLVVNRSAWRRFPRLWCENWVAGRHVILGDAAHTAHFSIGSGTRLAMEDALALVEALRSEQDVAAALAHFQAQRQPVARKIVDAANSSATWYEHFAEKMSLAPLEFAFDYITRSGRVDMERLRKLSPEFMARYEAARALTPIDPVADDSPGAREVGFNKALHKNCSAILWDNLERNPDKIAILSDAGSWSYAALIGEAARWGNAFLGSRLQRADRIALLLDDTAVYPAAFFGAVRAGLVPALLNTQANQESLRFFIEDSEARIVVCEAELLERLATALDGASTSPLVVAVNGGPSPTRSGVVNAREFLSGQPASLDCADTSPDDMAFWMYSSGSTGRPKGIVHLQHDMAFTQASYGARVLRLRRDDICFSVAKIFFAYGFGNSLTFPFSVGATSVLHSGQPRPESVLDTIERFKPSVLFALPTLFTALARSRDISQRDLSSLRMSISAAETLSKEIFDSWEAIAGHGPMEGLGSTEMLHIYLSNRPGDQRVGAAGACVPGYEIRLQGPAGEPAAPGEEGVMLVRGHSSAPRYWNRPDKTRETMRGDWVYTGDRFIERDGYYYFQGRADELIKVSGQWVWPLEVEQCLSNHPDVYECAVLSHELPDRRMTLRAIVRLRDAAAAGDSQRDKLRDYVKSQLQPYKYPRIIEFVAELPKTGTGKIDRQKLREMKA